MKKHFAPLCFLLAVFLFAGCTAPEAAVTPTQASAMPLSTEEQTAFTPAPTPGQTTQSTQTEPVEPQQSAAVSDYRVYNWNGQEYRYVWLEESYGAPEDFASMLPLLCLIERYNVRYDMAYPDIYPFDPVPGWGVDMNQHSLENPVYVWGFLASVLAEWGDLHPDTITDTTKNAQYVRIIPFNAARDFLAACFADYTADYQLPMEQPEGADGLNAYGLGNTLIVTDTGYAFTKEGLQNAQWCPCEPYTDPCLVQDCQDPADDYEATLWFGTDTLFYADPLFCLVTFSHCDASANFLGFPYRITRFVRYDGVDLYKYGL